MLVVTIPRQRETEVPKTMLLLVLLCWLAGTGQSYAQERLSGESSYPVGMWVGRLIGPAESRKAEIAAEVHVNRLGRAGFNALLCDYEISEGGKKYYGNVKLWHDRVGATQQELAAVSPVHPLAQLGDLAFERCPDRATALAHARRSLERFRKIAAGVSPDAPGPAPVIAEKFDPGLPVICAYIDTQSGNFEFYNNCDFDVNYSYCRSLLSTSRSQCQANGKIHFARSKARYRLSIPYTGTARAIACQHPYRPGTRVEDDHGFRKIRRICEPPRNPLNPSLRSGR